MANQLKQLLQVNQDADRLWSTDKSGGYVASYNEGGWGTPNLVLGESALLFVAVRKATEEEVLEANGTNLFYNSASLNTAENTCEFIFAADGWHRVTLMQLDVSTNDSTLVKTGTTIPNGAYYYYSGALYLRTSGAGVLIEEEDYIDLIENEDIVQDYAENIFFPKLAVKLNSIYQEYKDARNSGNQDDAAYQFRRFEELRFDLESAYNLFWTGLTAQSHDLVESLTKKYSV